MQYKTIVVPKDQEAKRALDYDKATSEQLIELVLDETEFKKLWGTGFFELINNIAEVNIDNYEDEAVEEKEKLEKVLASEIFTITIIDKVKQIKSLFEEALKRKTGVYFFF
ncbi:hypothetical protein ACTJJ0_34635 [Chitinophaga sp. 22321]|uniref:Uncharacterized protein n=1 Tax=Chitinophaga hostae TaxID=2831022 RepID=A0ABS5JBK3_9BACT|nr:hypothetical protein [Chitinophaga hostae]MBS0032458.1 hypothetical protein [Chitinophaga hostae]